MQWAFEEGPPIFERCSKLIRTVVKVFNIITQLGFCAVYFVFIPSTIKAVLDPYGIIIDIHIHMAIIFIPILLTSLVRNLKFLIPFSIIANISLGIGLVMTLYIAGRDLPEISSRPAVADLSKLPLFFGTAIYCFEGISMVLPFQNEMKEPEKFGSPFGVLNVGMTIVGGILIMIGSVGYLKYGEEVKGSVTLNFPPSL
uniref:Amino acid transporter transmembrane domain-containing protein n=4 Tax=Clastoptera arizonana TaxID=38151 RepID=A0A1B6D6L6_9HEMI